MFNFGNREAATEGKYQIREKELMKTVLAELERLLIHANIPYPVYFAFEDDDIDAVLADVKRSDVSGQPATATTGVSLLSQLQNLRKLYLPASQTFRGGCQD
ncbi:hypothetical protein OIU78_008962 [Salix suchowensis]|nr:hypothetical protein OIU78_008962 [Salix suchowensis]